MTSIEEFEDAIKQNNPENIIQLYLELLSLVKSGQKEFDECHASWSNIIVEKDNHISELTTKCSELTDLNETLKEQVAFYANAIRILEKQLKEYNDLE